MKTVLSLATMLVRVSAIFWLTATSLLSAATESRWTQFPYISSSVNDHVNVVVVAGNDVYVGGQFTQAGTNSANGVARWDGNEWTTLEAGVSGRVNAFEIYDDQLYVGGVFTAAGGKPSNFLASWSFQEVIERGDEVFSDRFQ